MAIAFAIGIVFTTEAFNSAIERLSDVAQPKRDDRIRNVKDIAAGAVLISAITAAIIGVIIFHPRIMRII